jgi:hypothetical protein
MEDLFITPSDQNVGWLVGVSGGWLVKRARIETN